MNNWLDTEKSLLLKYLNRFAEINEGGEAYG
jgi:hypothetical protein